MFKNMRLATKMGIGFFLIVLISAIVGGTGWYGLNSVSTVSNLQQGGNEALKNLNSCATLRRDLTIAKTEEEVVNTAKKWEEAYNGLTAALDKLSKSSDLTSGDRQQVDAALSSATGYKSAFEKLRAGRLAKDGAMAEWRTLGSQVTEQIGKAGNEVIKPARAAAEQARDIDGLLKWAKLDQSLSEQVIQPYYLLRISAVYLLLKNGEEEWKAYTEQLTKTQDAVKAWTASVQGDAGLQAAANEIQKLLESYAAAGEKYHTGMLDEQKAGSEMASAATGVVNAITQLDGSLVKGMENTIARSNQLSLLLTVLSIVSGLILALVITRSITKPINRVIAGLSEGATQLDSASGQVAASSQAMAEGASEQASSLEETSASMEEMASMTRQNSDNAKQADIMANDARSAAERGREAMNRMASAIDQIKKSSDETAKIIKTIDEIAFQTNLLALNAAVEAARAGDAGKGFAVVADEVRNLAQRSAEAAKTTSALIEGAQKNSEHGVAVSGEVAEILGEITTSVQRVSQLIGEVSAATSEQSQGIDQINTAVAQMDKVTQSNAANAEEAASASEELSAQARELNGMVDALVAIIGGTGAGRSQQTVAPKAPPRREKPVVERRALPPAKPAGKAPATPNKVVSPETVIPLEDGDFGDM